MSIYESPRALMHQERPQMKSDWDSLGSSNSVNAVLPQTRKWLDGLPSDVRPAVLAEHFPRIANLIALEWRNRSATRKLLDDYVIDRRYARRGLPLRVVQELKTLRNYAYARIQ